MGKLLWTEDEEQFNGIHPGCMSVIYPVLDYQNWHSNVKKILPHRKHAGKGNSYTRSIEARLKELVSEETLRNNHKKKGPSFLTGKKLQRTYSIHHLETDEWVDDVHPTISFSQNVNSEDFSKKDPDQDDTNRDIDQIIFPRILEDDSQVSLTKGKLINSGSFPLGGRNFRPTKLKHTVNDNWARKLDLSKLGSFALDDDLNNGNSLSIRRICSLNEHANRFDQFFDNNGTKEAMLCSFRSLKLKTDVVNIKSNGLEDDLFELPTEEEDGHQETQEITRLNPVSVPKCNSQEESHHLEFQISQGSKLGEETKNNIKSVNTHDQNEDCFNYVREILEQSDFIKNGFKQTWYSSNKILNPSVFQDIESQYPHDPDSFEEELIELSNRLHRFELVDEVLLKMYKRSFSYYPKPLSYSCHLSPAPSEKLVFEEVWKNLSRLLKLKPDKDQSLESIVSWDFRVSDDWMNLQMESECIAFELEDQIFSEILGEVFSS